MEKIIIIGNTFDTSLGALAVLLCLAGKQDMISINPPIVISDFTELAKASTVDKCEKFNSEMILAALKENKHRLDTRDVIPNKYKPKHKRRY